MTTSNVRPGPIVAVCFIWLLLLLQEMYLRSQQDISQLAQSQILLIVAATGASIVAITGIWMMKKWGVYLYIALFLINQIMSISNNNWQLGSVFIPLLIIAVCAAHLKKMS